MPAPRRRARSSSTSPSALGGTITGEHGVGLLKRSHLADQLGPAAQRLNAEIKRAFDPKGLLNPGKA